MTGIFLLENASASHAFTPARIAALELLAAQAAISLENTRLYSELQERESKVRRLVDSNIIGVLTGNLDGYVQEANQAFLDILGYDQADLAAGRLRRTELTPPEWQERDAQALAEMTATGTAQPYEKEYFRKDGSRVPVLVGGATFGERSHAVVAFVIDLTDRKRAEAAMRESEWRYREVQTELAHANRVATMGQLAASIAHEVSQPIAAILTNAETSARWLGRETPNLEKAQQMMNYIISDGKRAANIISGIRDLVKKAPSQWGSLAINEVILETLALTRSDLSKSGIRARTELTKNLPLIQGDRVQVQQVMLNLIMNAIEALSEVDGRTRELLIGASEVEPDSVLVTVSDTGPGLAPASLARNLRGLLHDQVQRFGDGLSICRSIVEAHGGRLWATSNEPHGAAFYMMLPVGQRSCETKGVRQ